jgi:hypothetical protein
MRFVLDLPLFRRIFVKIKTIRKVDILEKTYLFRVITVKILKRISAFFSFLVLGPVGPPIFPSFHSEFTIDNERLTPVGCCQFMEGEL